MNIDKAINILNLITTKTLPGRNKELNDAIKLGIEALKRIKAQRGPGGEIGALGLSGETED